jgi:hypothetical protein
MTEVRCESEAARSDVPLDELVQARLENRDLAAFERPDLRLVLVDAGDDMAEIRETGAGDKANVTGTNNHNAHVTISPR